MPIRFTQRIVEHLSHDQYRPSPQRQILRDMRVDDEDREAFSAAVKQLAEDGRIIIGEDENLRLPSFADEITGKFRLNPKGFGFIIPDQKFREGDLFVPPGSSGGAISGDRVRARVYRGGGSSRRGGPAPGRSGFTGKIIEVLERGQEHFVGVLHKEGKQWLVEPDGRSLHDQVIIRDPHAKNAKAGDKVVFELVHYPDGDYLPEGVIVRVLGTAGKPDVETEAVIAAHGLRTEFPQEAVEQAREASRRFDAQSRGPWPDREDLTGDFIFTIDPPDAKDFDDAISIRRNERSDEWELGVHIADVSHFIPIDSPLDVEARERGNSVYLPRLVIPMLPEVLSNGVCSLQEGVPRFTKSVFITFDGKGNVTAQRVASTVISSRKRMTYLEAQALIDGDQNEARKNSRTEPNYTEELIATLRHCDTLAKILEKRRTRDGMIVLSLPEVDLVFDEAGHVIDAQPEDDAYTHKLIEMFMVEANEALARIFESINIPILRRIHPDPAHGDMEELRMFALAANVSVPDEPTRRDLQSLLEKTRHTPAARAIHFAVLRTLSKATYSPALVGHFALASEHYAHFTSPIRRYPDLTLHRALQAFLELTDNGRGVPGGKKRKALARQLATDARVLDEGTLIELGKKCSETEVEAETAERELREFLVMQFLHEKHLGDEFQGVVTGIANSGVFVSIDRYLVEGKVAWQDVGVAAAQRGAAGPDAIGSDRKRSSSPPRRERGGRGGAGWHVNESTGRATSTGSGAVLAVGDIVTVQIVQVDLAARHLDMLITKMPKRAATDLPKPARSKSGGRQETRGKRKGFNKGRRGRKFR